MKKHEIGGAVLAAVLVGTGIFALSQSTWVASELVPVLASDEGDGYLNILGVAIMILAAVAGGEVHQRTTHRRGEKGPNSDVGTHRGEAMRLDFARVGNDIV